MRAIAILLVFSVRVIGLSLVAVDSEHELLANTHNGTVRSGPASSRMENPYKSSDEQKLYAVTEDVLSSYIWRKYTNQVAAGDFRCGPMMQMVQGYASSQTKWDPVKDVDNPEAPPDIAAANKDLATLRNSLTSLLGQNAEQIPCIEIVYLLADPLASVRVLAPFEFVFKSDKKWVQGAATNYKDPNDKLKTDALTAYSWARCMPGASTCDKRTPDNEVRPLFRTKKGRGTWGGYPGWPHATLHGGTSELPWLANDIDLEVLKDPKKGDYEYPALNNFWDVQGKALHKTMTPDKCRAIALHAHAMTSVHADSDGAALSEQIDKMCDVIAENKPATTFKGSHYPGADSNDVQKEFKLCNVPWVGGVSGSALEMFALFEWKNPGKITDRLILQWMALYNLMGFHSLAEVWVALYPFLVNLGYVAPGAGATSGKSEGKNRLTIMKVSPPLLLTSRTVDGNCLKPFEDSKAEDFGEHTFLEQLVGVVMAGEDAKDQTVRDYMKTAFHLKVQQILNKK